MIMTTYVTVNSRRRDPSFLTSYFSVSASALEFYFVPYLFIYFFYFLEGPAPIWSARWSTTTQCFIAVVNDDDRDRRPPSWKIPGEPQRSKRKVARQRRSFNFSPFFVCAFSRTSRTRASMCLACDLSLVLKDSPLFYLFERQGRDLQQYTL